MTVRDALAAAIAAHIGQITPDAYVVHPWRSATFEGERHCFRCTVPDVDRALAAAPELCDAEIALHTGFCADAAVRPAGGCTVEIEFLVVAD